VPHSVVKKQQCETVVEKNGKPVPLSQAAQYNSHSYLSLDQTYFQEAYKPTKRLVTQKDKRNRNAPIISQSEPIRPNASKEASNDAIGSANPT
jgi:hypothetical protein